MGEVSITLNGRVYHMACDDGQEDHLMQLSDYVGERVSDLVESVGQVGDARLLAMASLLLADELAEMRVQMEALRRDAGGHMADAEDALADQLDMLAQRLEKLAEGLEAS